LDTSLYKKGEKSECYNYRGISLLNTAYKILATVINNRMKTYEEYLLSQELNGNRSAVDNTYVIRLILDKCYEYNIEMQLQFFLL
jgi:sorting nexin-29